MDKPPFDLGGPIRAFRDRYAAPFAGVSYDLAPRAVGVDPARLEAAPDLVGRRVLVTSDATRGPLVRRPQFHVVPIGRLMRNAREVAASGGLVFSSFDLDDPTAGDLLAALAVGDVVYLNAAVDRLPDAAVRRPFADGDAVAS